MTTHVRLVMIAIALLALANAGTVWAFERVAVTVRQLFDQGHRLEITAGTEVAWADPHFDRVWFKPSADNPKVEHMAGGFRATFAKIAREGVWCDAIITDKRTLPRGPVNRLSVAFEESGEAVRRSRWVPTHVFFRYRVGQQVQVLRERKSPWRWVLIQDASEARKMAS